MKKQLLILMLFLFILAPTIIAETTTLKEVKQGDCITLRQKYANSTYTNVTTITYPNETEQVVNIAMVGSNGVWNYEFCNTSELGDYEYCTRTDVDGIDTDVCIDFKVTPNGSGGTSNLVFFMFVFLFLYSINLFGFFGKNEIMTILGGMALLFLGIYSIQNGIIIFRDNLTNYISYITIAWGAISAIWAAIALIQDGI